MPAGGAAAARPAATDPAYLAVPSAKALRQAAGMTVTVSGNVAIDLGNGRTTTAQFVQDVPAQSYSDAPVNPVAGGL